MYTQSKKGNGFNKIIEVIYFSVILLSFYLVNSKTSNSIPLKLKYGIAVGFILFAVVIFVLRRKQYISKVSIFFLFTNLLPYLVILFVILWRWLLMSDITLDYVKDNITVLLYWIIPILEMISAVYLLKEKAIDITFYGTICSYTINVVMYLSRYRMKGIINFFDYGREVGSLLETHELTFTLGLLFIYYLFFENKSEKSHKFKIAISVLYLFLGYKRIQIIALIIVYITYKVFFGKKGKINKKTLYILGSFVLIFCFAYIIFIKYGRLYNFAEKYDINFMSRLGAYLYFEQDYTISIFFMGKGLGFVVNKLALAGNSLFGIADLHNDILKFYIELGFIMTILLFANYLIFQTRRLINKFDDKVAVLYFMLTLYTFIIFATDNIARYLHYNLVFTMIPYVYTLINIEKLNNEIIS